MESFFLAETTKYLYLLFTPDHWIHNKGGKGEVINTTNGECIIDAGNNGNLFSNAVFNPFPLELKLSQ